MEYEECFRCKEDNLLVLTLFTGVYDVSLVPVLVWVRVK